MGWLHSVGYPAVYLKEPTDGAIGQKLRHMMVHNRKRDHMEEFQLFLQDRAEDVRLNIRPMLDRGGVVCIDRYYISSMAYQGALGLDPQFIRTENEKIAPVPDCVLYFRLPLEESLRRIIASRPEGHNLFEIRSYQEKVRSIFEHMDLPNFHAIDASLSPGEVHKQVRELMQQHIHAKVGQN